jgi:hypothetical protein
MREEKEKLREEKAKEDTSSALPENRQLRTMLAEDFLIPIRRLAWSPCCSSAKAGVGGGARLPFGVSDTYIEPACDP